MLWLLENFEWMVLMAGAAVIAWAFANRRSLSGTQQESGSADDDGAKKS